TELRVGVPFPTAALEIVVSAIGPAAQTLALTGQVIDIDAALSIGLVHRHVNPESLVNEAIECAADLSTINPEVYTFTKQQLHRLRREHIHKPPPAHPP